MINNLCGSLDHLVWQLVLLNDEPPNEGNSFPIVKREENWDKAAAARLKGVADEHRDKIRSVQRFHDGPNAPHDLLAVIDHANNLNTHRVISPFLTSTMAIQPVMRFNLASTGSGEKVVMETMSPETRITDGTVLGRARTESPNNDFYVESVDPISVDTIGVSFDIGGDGPPDNSAVFAEVKRIISLFKPAFGS